MKKKLNYEKIREIHLTVTNKSCCRLVLDWSSSVVMCRVYVVWCSIGCHLSSVRRLVLAWLSCVVCTSSGARLVVCTLSSGTRLLVL